MGNFGTNFGTNFGLFALFPPSLQIILNSIVVDLQLTTSTVVDLMLLNSKVVPLTLTKSRVNIEQ